MEKKMKHTTTPWYDDATLPPIEISIGQFSRLRTARATLAKAKQPITV